ncbi:MAG: hypothetical protein R3E56_12865 [Burkholderiaceae bacterium]
MVHERDPGCSDGVEHVLHVWHLSLFAPRDLDVSPFFEMVKPSLSAGFDPHGMHWGAFAPVSA